MRLRFALAFLGLMLSSSFTRGQASSDPPPAAPEPSAAAQESRVQQASTATAPITVRLTVKDAEKTALRNNPAISVARLNALASQQVVREVRSSYWPQASASLTAVSARDNSRITAGSLNNPIIYSRAAGGATISQLLTDFGHTSNLVASSRLQAKADEQNAAATKEDVLAAVD